MTHEIQTEDLELALGQLEDVAAGITGGTGTLTLSGANTYTGTTSISDGTLTVGTSTQRTLIGLL